MQGAASQDEGVRLKTLARCNILDTPREAVFDGLVFTAAQLFRTKMATLSLLDAERSWFKAHVGMYCTEVERRSAFCSHVVRAESTLVVEDTWLDPRFSQISVVTGTPYIRFCAAAPVTGPGNIRIGGLCVFDTRPRAATPHERTQLLYLAKQASELLAARVTSPA